MDTTIERMFAIEKKTVLISGGGGGIASGIAEILGAVGARIVLIDVKRDALERAAEMIRKTGAKTLLHQCDITSKGEVEEVIDDIEQNFGPIDFLINCAGLSWVEPAIDFDEMRWDSVINVNLKGTFLLCQTIGRYMLQRQFGRIVNFSSVRGLQGRSGDMAYAPSKGAINQLTRSLAIEWGTSGINVNAVAPTFTLTEMNRDQIEDKTTYDWILSRIPKKRLCSIENLAGAVIFLLSPASDFITGQILYVDGGWTAA